MTHQVDGLFRLGPNGEVIKSHYDFDTKKLGIYTIDIPIPVSYNCLVEDRPVAEKRLWSHLLSSDALATMRWNNTLILNIYRDYIVLFDYSHEGNTGNELRYLDKPLVDLHVSPMGYMPTYQPKYKSLAMQPFIVYGTQGTNVVFYHGEIVFLEHQPDTTRFTGSLYQEVLKHDADIAYYDVDGILRCVKIK